MNVVYTDSDLETMIQKEFILSKNSNLLENVQPSSIDIPLGNKAYLVKQKFIPFLQNVSDIVKDLSIQELDLKQGNILLKNQTYLIPTLDVNLPENFSISISPKSSIGRVDLFVRSVFDNYHYYDRIPQSGKGKLWLEVTPQSYNIFLKEGLSLSQLMVFDESFFAKDNIVNESFLYDDLGEKIKNNFHKENKLLLTLKAQDNFLFGYEAKQTNEILDLTKVNYHEPSIFFNEINAKNNSYTLEKDHFYILRTSEKISIPSKYSAEMIPVFHLIGELRAHYAGFFDPGFGYGKNGEIKGSAGVLEVRPHETITVSDKQPICLLEYYKNIKTPKINYGSKGNHYQGQDKPKLAKFFKN